MDQIPRPAGVPLPGPTTPRGVGGVVVVGMKKVQAGIARRQAMTNKLLLTGLMKAGRQLQADAQGLVPVDTGQLKRSARTDATKTGVNPEVWVSFNTDYALVQHETLWFNHTVGQAKYLIQPAKTNHDSYVRIVKRDVLFFAKFGDFTS